MGCNNERVGDINECTHTKCGKYTIYNGFVLKDGVKYAIITGSFKRPNSDYITFECNIISDNEYLNGQETSINVFCG